MMPEGWNTMKISDVLEKVVLPVSVSENEEYKEIGIRSHGKGIFYKEKKSGKSLGNKRVFHIEPNCLVLNIVFAWEQAVAKTTENEQGMIASHRFPMYRPKNNLCHVDFLLYLFKTKLGKNLLELASPGGAGRNKTLGQGEFARLEVSLPSLSEQIKIVEILSTWDQAIRTIEKLLAISKLQKKALLQKLLTGKNRFPSFSEEWKNNYLINVAKVIVSSVDKKSLEGEESVLLCNYTNVYHNHKITQNLDFMQATATKSEIERFTVQRGDVLITKDSETPGDIAVPALVAEDLKGVVCGYHLAIIRPKKKELDGAFLNYLFSMPQTKYYFFTLATGATRFGLSISGINKAHFKLAPLEEQQKIASVLSLFDRDIEVQQQKLDYLTQEKKALMQQLLTGKRRVYVKEAK